MYVEPERQMVELLETVAPSNMHVRPLGAGRTGASPIGQVTPSVAQRPSSQRYCVPPWQLAEPVEYETPLYSQVFDGAGAASSLPHTTPSAFQSPSLQRYCDPDWHAAAPSEYIVPLKKQ
jgi:hypothetical protein